MLDFFKSFSKKPKFYLTIEKKFCNFTVAIQLKI